MQNLSTHMVLDVSASIEPAPVILSKTGLLVANQGQIISVDKKPYQIVESTTKVKTKDNIRLTTQFIYVRHVTPNRIFNALQTQFGES